MDTSVTQRLATLLEVTRKMRYYQKRWFKFRIGAELRQAKYYEKRLDELIEKEDRLKDTPQQKLF